MPSTWPETMWPPSSSPIFSARSRLMRVPGCQLAGGRQPQRLLPGLDLEPALVRARFGQAGRPSGRRRRRRSRRRWRWSRDRRPCRCADACPRASGVTAATAPISVTMPVNISRPLSHSQQMSAPKRVVARTRRKPGGIAVADRAATATPPSPIVPGPGRARSGRPDPRPETARAVSAPPSTRSVEMPCAARSSSSSGRAMRPSMLVAGDEADARAVRAPARRPASASPAAATRTGVSRALDASFERGRQPRVAVEHDADRRARFQPRQAARSVRGRRPAPCRCRPGSHRFGAHADAPAARATGR